MGVPKEEEGGKEAERFFKEIIAENYPSLGKKEIEHISPWS